MASNCKPKAQLKGVYLSERPMTNTLFSPKTSHFLVSVAAPLLAIATYTVHVGVPTGASSTLAAAVLAAAAVPLANRLVLEPFLKAIGQANDLVLRVTATVTLNGAIGLFFAVWTLPSAFR